MTGGPITDEANKPWPLPDRTLLGARPWGLPAFPVDVLPAFWRQWCEDGARGAGVPVDYVALGLLTAGAGLLGGARRICPVPAWAEPCVLWSVLVGAPASGKTAAMEMPLRLLRALDHELADDNDRGRRVWLAARERARAEIWSWRGELRGAAANHLPSPEMPQAAPAPPAFAPRQLVVEDAALAAVTGALCGNPRGILLALDPMSAWLGGLGTGADHSERLRAERQSWLKTWSAGRWQTSPGDRSVIDLDRTAGVHIAHAAVSILGTLEPETACTDDDSLGARMLFAWPAAEPARPLSAAAALCPEALRALRRLRDMPDGPRLVPLSPDAGAAFEDIRYAHRNEAEELDGMEAAWWRKGAGTVLRLAGILTWLDWAASPDDELEPQEVTVDALEAARDLWTGYSWPHARAALGIMENAPCRRQAHQALRWIRRHALTELWSGHI